MSIPLYKEQTIKIEAHILFNEDVEMADGHLLKKEVKYSVISKYGKKYIIICVDEEKNNPKFYIVPNTKGFFSHKLETHYIRLKLGEYLLDYKSKSLCRYVGSVSLMEDYPENDNEYPLLTNLSLIFSSDNSYKLCLVKNTDYVPYKIDTSKSKRLNYELILLFGYILLACKYAHSLINGNSIIMNIIFGLILGIILISFYINNIDPLGTFKLFTKKMTINGIDFYYVMLIDVKSTYTLETYNIYYRDRYKLNSIEVKYVNSVVDGKPYDKEIARIEELYRRIITDNFDKNIAKILESKYDMNIRENAIYNI